MTVDDPILQLTDIKKSYGHVEALRGVSMSAAAGEVVGLLGDNGAGKSTLVKVLSGIIRPDSGRLAVEGEPRRFTSPKQARRLGIETVHQHLALAPNLDVAANLFLNRELRHPNPVLAKIGWMAKAEMWDRTAEILGTIHADIPTVRQNVSLLSGGQRQAIAVGRAIGWGTRIVLMDEPVAALGVEQTAYVLELIESLRERGILVILITHNMQEVMAVCSRAVVLRRGSVVADLTIDDVSARDLVDYITGVL